jgi:hypothetical protein
MVLYLQALTTKQYKTQMTRIDRLLLCLEEAYMDRITIIPLTFCTVTYYLFIKIPRVIFFQTL